MQILYVHATIANTRSNVINKYDSLSGATGRIHLLASSAYYEFLPQDTVLASTSRGPRTKLHASLVLYERGQLKYSRIRVSLRDILSMFFYPLHGLPSPDWSLTKTLRKRHCLRQTLRTRHPLRTRRPALSGRSRADRSARPASTAHRRCGRAPQQRRRAQQ